MSVLHWANLPKKHHVKRYGLRQIGICMGAKRECHEFIECFLTVRISIQVVFTAHTSNARLCDIVPSYARYKVVIVSFANRFGI